MGRTSYFILFLWMIISFIALLTYTFQFGPMSFLREFFVILVLIVLAFVALFMIGARKDSGWIAAVVFFAVLLVNMAYLLFKSSSPWIFIIGLIAALGFVFSTAMIRRFREEIAEFPEPEERVVEWEKEAEALEKAEKSVEKEIKKVKRRAPRKRAKKTTRRKR